MTLMTNREHAAAYLDEQRATLWGRAFDLSEPASFEEAEDLLTEVLNWKDDDGS